MLGTSPAPVRDDVLIANQAAAELDSFLAVPFGPVSDPPFGSDFTFGLSASGAGAFFFFLGLVTFTGGVSGASFGVVDLAGGVS